MTAAAWQGAQAYEAYIGRWSRQVAPRFVDWLSVPGGRSWVDVGCGTGALSATILQRAEPAALVGVDPSADFVAQAAAAIDDPRARFLTGSAAELPVGDDWADAVVAGLVLNFVPDLAAALVEMRRVVRTNGTVGGYVWDYADGMQLIRRLFDAAIALDPAAASHDEGARFAICAPEPLRRAFEAAGFADVSVTAIEVPTVFRDFDDFWSPFLGGVGPAPAYVVSLEPEAREHLRERLRTTLPTAADGSIPLVARAWAARARVPDGVTDEERQPMTPMEV